MEEREQRHHVHVEKPPNGKTAGRLASAKKRQ